MHFHKTVFSEKFSTDIARSSLYSFHPMLFTVFQSVTFIFPLHDTYDQPLFTSLCKGCFHSPFFIPGIWPFPIAPCGIKFSPNFRKCYLLMMGLEIGLRTKITTKYRISYKYWFFVTFGAANMLKGFIYGL